MITTSNDNNISHTINVHNKTLSLDRFSYVEYVIYSTLLMQTFNV